MEPYKAYKKRENKAEPNRVKLGAKFLDKHRPGWYKEIAITTLNMDHGEHCILGQLCGSFIQGRMTLKINDCIEFGFYSPKKLWIKEIKDRQNDGKI